MASQRITAAIRDSLIKAALDRRFVKERKALEAEGNALEAFKREMGQRAYEALYDAKKISKVPEGWLPKTDAVRVNVVGDYGGNVKQIKFYTEDGVGLPVPSKDCGYGTITTTVEADHVALKDQDTLENMKRDWQHNWGELRQAERELAAKVRGVIESVTTTNRLKEIWPECAELLPSGAQPAGSMLPAINLDDLNKELGLGK